MLEAADDAPPGSDALAEKVAEAERTSKSSLDDLLNQKPQPKPDWPS
jgi:hypothetical protein